LFLNLQDFYLALFSHNISNNYEKFIPHRFFGGPYLYNAIKVCVNKLLKYRLLIVYRHTYLFSSINRQPLLKLSTNSNSITMAKRCMHAHLLTVLFHFANCTFSLKPCYSQVISM